MNPALLARRLALILALPLFLGCGGGGGGGSPGGDGGADAGPGVGGGAPGAPDTVAPAVTLTAPANVADGLLGAVALAASASDNVAVARVEFEVDGMPVASDTVAPYEASVEAAAFAAGQHTVRARAADAAGNLSDWASATVRFGGGSAVPAGFSKTEGFVAGLTRATAIAQSRDGRLFIAEQDGALRVVKGGQLLAQPFIRLAVDGSGERGLLGVALHPDFPATPQVFLYYTTAAGGTHNRISRFIAMGDVAAPSSELVLVDLPPLSGATNHNGGALHFGRDGKLYAGVGENADGARSQDLTSPLGKLLRFNDDGSIPPDNPFSGTQQGLARAIWAYGLRNPFTFAVQPGTGRIHINDVGQNTWEEINVGAAGANYGWPGSEGPDRVSPGVVAPLFAYGHGGAAPPGSGPGGFFTGFSIAGGAFYPAAGPFPQPYRENYFFADFVTRFVARLDPANGNAAYAFASLGDAPVDMLVDLDGALLVLARTSVIRIAAI